MTARLRVLLLGYALTIGFAALAASRERPSEVMVWLCVAFAPYLLIVLKPLPSRFPSLRMSLFVAALGGAAFSMLPPVLSDDVHRFVWEGRLWWQGENPFLRPPDDPALAPMRDEVWSRINNRDLTTAYPPLAQLLFAVVALTGGGIVAVKVFALALHLLAVWFMARTTGPLGTAAPLAVALNPLALSEAALHAHIDIAVGTLLLAVALAIARSDINKAALHVVTATGMKVIGIVLLPRLWSASWRGGIIATVGAVAMLVPLALPRAAGEGTHGARELALRWRGNDLAYGWVESFAGLLVGDSQDASMVARAAVVLCVLGAALWYAARKAPPLRAARNTVFLLLLLSPQVHPWYLLWLLPLEIASRRVAGVCWSGGVLLSYVAVEGWVQNQVWVQPTWTYAAQYGLLFAVLAWEVVARREFFDPHSAIH